MSRWRWTLAGLGLALSATNIAAQVEFSALIDLVLNPGLDIADDTGDSDSNAASRGDDPFHVVRGRLFMDGDVADWLSVNTRFLFDHDVWRIEPAVGVRLARGAVLKVVAQATFRAGPTGDTEDYLLASQLSLGI